MNRTLALKMALVMLNKSLENKITLEEFKQTTDSILLENKNMKNHNSIEYEEDTGTYKLYTSADGTEYRENGEAGFHFLCD